MKLSKKERLQKLQTLAKPVNPNDAWRVRAAAAVENQIWESDAMRIGYHILNALDTQELTQRDLANRLEVSPQAINKIIKGRTNPTLGTIRKIEVALDIKLISIIGVEDKKSINAPVVVMKGKYNTGHSLSVGYIDKLATAPKSKSRKKKPNNSLNIAS